VTAGAAVGQLGAALASERFRKLLTQAKERYELIVLDTPPLLAVADTRELLPQVDAVLLCVRASRTTRDEAQAARQALAALPNRPTGLVVTGVRSGDEQYYGYYSYAYESNV